MFWAFHVLLRHNIVKLGNAIRLVRRILRFTVRTWRLTQVEPLCKVAFFPGALLVYGPLNASGSLLILTELLSRLVEIASADFGHCLLLCRLFVHRFGWPLKLVEVVGQGADPCVFDSVLADRISNVLLNVLSDYLQTVSFRM